MSLIRAAVQWIAVCAFCLAFSYVLVEGLDRQLANEQATYSECEGC